MDRRFNTSSHVARQIMAGATRNLILRGPYLDFSPSQIREDLDHIHNLVVVDIYPSPEGDGTVISLNAIHLALFAKTCMMSQAVYKKATIRFYPDECANPLPTVSPIPKNIFSKVVEKKAVAKDGFRSLTNRFGLLNLDGPEKGSSSDETDSTLMTGSP